MDVGYVYLIGSAPQYWGAFDFVTIVEAPNNEAVARMSAELESSGTIKIMGLPALSADHTVKSLKTCSPDLKEWRPQIFDRNSLAAKEGSPVRSSYSKE